MIQKALSKFFIIKTFIYLLWFTILWYLFINKSDIIDKKTEYWYASWTNNICFTDNCFDLEIADSDEERQQWLMYREVLSNQSGMLFVFDNEGIYPFWMKNTKIPLDIIWIDKNNIIVDIYTAQPCKEDPCQSYKPSWSGLYVLEINAWLSSLLWMKKWSKLQFMKK